MQNTDPNGAPEGQTLDARRPWRRPALRRIDALDARQVKSRARHDALHLS